MSKGGGQVIGYGYAIDLVYAFCEKADYLSGYRMGGDVHWEGHLENSGDGFTAATGKRGDTYKSDFHARSAIQIWLGGDSIPEQIMSGATYRNVVLAHFRNYCAGKKGKEDGNLLWCWCGDEPSGDPDEYILCSMKDFLCGEEDDDDDEPPAFLPPCEQEEDPETNTIPIESFRLIDPEAAFVGDNTTHIPEYEFRFHRYDVAYDIFGDTQKVVRGINPAVAIYDIIVNQLKISQDKIDINSFVYAAQILADERLGLSFILTRSKKATAWIKEILRYADGILYYDTFQEKYVLKLFRKDYDETTLIELDEDNISNLVVERSAWTNVISTFRFKYSYDWEKTSNTYEIINSAVIEVNGYETTKEFNFQMISDPICLPHLMTRTIQKHGMPATKVKFRVNHIIGATLRPGDVVKLKSDRLQIAEILLRIVKIGGDKEENPYFDIECINDIYANPIEILEIPEITYRNDVDIFLEKKIKHYRPLVLPHEYCKTDNLSDNNWLIVAAPTEANEYVEAVRTVTAFQEAPSYAEPFQFGRIIKASKDGLQNLTEIGYNRDFQLVLTNPKTVENEDEQDEETHYRFVHNVELTEDEFQQGQLMLITERDNGIFYARSLTLFENNDDEKRVLITGIIDPTTSLFPDEWYSGDTDTLYDVDWGDADKIYIRSYKPLSIYETVSFPGQSASCEKEGAPTNRIGFTLVNTYTSSKTEYTDAKVCFDFWKPMPPANINYQYFEGEGLNPNILSDNSDILTIPFDNEVKDYSTQYACVINGNEEYVDGQFDKAFNFSGGDYIEVSQLKSIASHSASVSAWVNFIDDSGEQVVFSFSTDDEKTLELLFKNNALILIQDGLEKGSIDGAITVQEGVYTHIVVTSGGKVYVNNDLKFDTGYSIDTNLFNRSFIIGCGRNTLGGTTNYFVGHIDHFRVFNKIVSDDDVRKLFNEVPSTEGYYEVRWRPTYFKIGAGIQNCDEWNGYDDEGRVWGNYAVEKADSNGNRIELYCNIADKFANDEGWVTLRIPKHIADANPNWRIYNWNPEFGGAISDNSYIQYGYEEFTAHFTIN